MRRIPAAFWASLKVRHAQALVKGWAVQQPSIQFYYLYYACSLLNLSRISKKVAHINAELVIHLPLSNYNVRGASLHQTPQNSCLHTFYFGLIWKIWRSNVSFQWTSSPETVNIATLHSSRPRRAESWQHSRRKAVRAPVNRRRQAYVMLTWLLWILIYLTF